MTIKGDRRRALLGPDTCAAARHAGKHAPAPGPELYRVLQMLLDTSRRRAA